MKLSKAQQAVVDKIREGWELININDIGVPALRIRRKGKVTEIVNRKVFNSLIKMEIIEIYDDSYPTPYVFTEQYKTANNEL